MWLAKCLNHSLMPASVSESFEFGNERDASLRVELVDRPRLD
jgi:hypothetical protein